MNRDLSRFELNTLNELIFKCKSKQDCTYRYEDAVKHANTCAIKPVKCTQGNCTKMFVNREDFRAHILRDCLEIEVECEMCELTKKRSENKKHDCKDGF